MRTGCVGVFAAVATIGFLLLSGGGLSAKTALEIAAEQINASDHEREQMLKEVTGLLESDPWACRSIEDKPDFQNFFDTVIWAAARKTFFDQTLFAKSYPHLYAYGKVALVDGNFTNPVYYQLPGDRTGQPHALTGDRNAVRPIVCEVVRIKKWDSPVPDDEASNGSFTFLDRGKGIYLFKTSISPQTHGSKTIKHRLFWYRIDGQRLIPDRFETYLVPSGKETAAGRLISTSYPIEPIPEPAPLLDSAGNPPPPIIDSYQQMEDHPAAPPEHESLSEIVTRFILNDSENTSRGRPEAIKEALSILEKHPEIGPRLSAQSRIQNVKDQIFWAAARDVSFDQAAFIRRYPYLANYGKILLVSAKYYKTPRIIYQHRQATDEPEPRMLYGNSDMPMAAASGTAKAWEGEQGMADWNGNYAFEDNSSSPRLCRISMGRLTAHATEARHILYCVRVESTQLVPDRCEAYLVPPGKLRDERYLMNISYARKIVFDNNWLANSPAPPSEPSNTLPGPERSAAEAPVPHPVVPPPNKRQVWDYIAWTALGAGCIVFFVGFRGKPKNS